MSCQPTCLWGKSQDTWIKMFRLQPLTKTNKVVTVCVWFQLECPCICESDPRANDSVTEWSWILSNVMWPASPESIFLQTLSLCCLSTSRINRGQMPSNTGGWFSSWNYTKGYCYCVSEVRAQRQHEDEDAGIVWLNWLMPMTDPSHTNTTPSLLGLQQILWLKNHLFTLHFQRGATCYCTAISVCGYLRMWGSVVR